MTQRRELPAEDRARLDAAKQRRDDAVDAYQRLVLELGQTIGVNAVCREAGISTSVYADWKKKHGTV